MHFISLELKRAHWASVRATRDFAELFGLTPARFDLLYVIHEQRPGSQAAIARCLGFSGATIGRMLKSLQDLGWIRRVTASDDRRAKHVALTPRGVARMRTAIRALIDQRSIHRIFQRAFGIGRRAIAAARGAADTVTARAVYHEARGHERDRVFWALGDVHDSAAHVASELNGRATQLVYRTFLPDE